MMKVVVIGAGGPVGRALCRRLGRANGEEIIRWDREKFPLHIADAVSEGIGLARPDLVVNLAVASKQPEGQSRAINALLPGQLASLSKQLDFKLIHTSSVMVFTDRRNGPFFRDTPPDADSGYGAEKRQAEEFITAASSNSVILRLGWQIVDEPGSNNMVDHLDRLAASGPIEASTEWFPSCSWVDETANALWNCKSAAPGLYQLNSNPGLSYFELVEDLKARLKRDWRITPSDKYRQNQMMVDDGLG